MVQIHTTLEKPNVGAACLLRQKLAYWVMLG